MADNQEWTCPNCGGQEWGIGKLEGHATLRPFDRIFSTGSSLLVELCTDCGYVSSIRVQDPKKFKRKR